MRLSLPLLSLVFLTSSAGAGIIQIGDFETGIDGWKGKTSTSSTGATKGSLALEIDATGSTGWNQELAVMGEAAQKDYSNAVELLMEVNVPAGTIAKAGFIEFIPVFSGPLNGWYMLNKVPLQDGLNKIAMPVDGSKVGKPWKTHLVLNSGDAIPGKVYVDNIRLRTPGAPGKLQVMVVDDQGTPVKGAIVGVGSMMQTTVQGGLAFFDVPSDPYKGEVLSGGLVSTKFEVDVAPGTTTKKTVQARRLPNIKAHEARVWVQPDNKIRTFDSQKIYGHNIALWNNDAPFKDPESIKRLKQGNVQFIRFPGGEYGNRYNWRNNQVSKKDGSPEWVPEATWNDYVKLLKQLGPKAEMMMIANIFQMTPQDTVDWISDAKSKGIRLRYVELGNEPDLTQDVSKNGKLMWWTHVENYVSEYVKFAKAIRAAHPDIKIMGPCIAQIINRECIDQAPWMCDNDESKPFWIEKFLRLLQPHGDLIDVISMHSYPYWPGDIGGGVKRGYVNSMVFETPDAWKKWLPLWKSWVNKYYPEKARTMEFALTEFNVQVPEESTTAKLVNATWTANYLGEYIKYGGDIANIWDLHTHKVADGGGHGIIDPKGDPTRPWAQRSNFWLYKMMSTNFTGTMVDARSNTVGVAAYASTDRGRTTVLLVNRNQYTPVKTTIQIKDLNAGSMRHQRLSNREYLWSEQLYRAVINTGPTDKAYAAPKPRQGWTVIRPTLEPLSVQLFIFE